MKRPREEEESGSFSTAMTSPLMLSRKVIAVYCYSRTKHLIQYAGKIQFLNI